MNLESKVKNEFNRNRFKSEDSAIEFFTLRDWYLNTYHGSNGIVFTKPGHKSIVIHRGLFWMASIVGA